MPTSPFSSGSSFNNAFLTICPCSSFFHYALVNKFSHMYRFPLLCSLLLVPPAMAEVQTNDSSASIASYTQQDQVSSVSQFSDVLPTDWAYQALSNLVEQYGCVAGYPNGSFRGNRAITRYEAAALLNACLERVSEVTDELRRLIQEFKAELAILKGRVDGLEARVGELEATQFSTTTKLSGTAAFLFGATKYLGSGAHNVSSGKRNASLPNYGAGPTDGLHFVYDLRLDLNTSFTGKDLLKTRLEAGNMNASSFGLGSATPLSYYSWIAPLGGSDNELTISRLWYNFPIGESFRVTVGPRVRQDELLATWPVRYPSEIPLFGIPWYAGNPGVYNLNLGPGAGLTFNTKFNDTKFSAAAIYVAGAGNSSSPSTGGLGTEFSQATSTLQASFYQDEWNITLAYNYTQADVYPGMGTPYFTQNLNNPMHSWAVSGFYDFNVKNKFIPTLNLGAGMNHYEDDDFGRVSSASWYSALMWKDLIADGQDFGISFGQPTFVTDIKHGSPSDGGYFLETYYRFAVTDNVSVTPTFLWLSRPYGEETKAITGKDNFQTLAFMLKTNFRF